jgi:branched-subunit amino acid aminotransferase/4-amino-4-deoxychorismate lyase
MMIWHAGQLISNGALLIDADDRTFQHGLGLFETFRTWRGRPSLLARHLHRMVSSARQLDLALEDELPDVRAVLELIDANRDELVPRDDVRLRITLTGGGLSPSLPMRSVMWMTAQPLVPPFRDSGLTVGHTMQVTNDDPLARHKTLNYWRKRIALATAHDVGSDDVLCITPDGFICETCRANIFLVESDRLLTPSLEGPLLPGVMRQVVLERAAVIGIPVEEKPLPLVHVQAADEAFLTNSLRGIVPIAELLDRDLPAPGPITRRLWSDVRPWLERGERE